MAALPLAVMFAVGLYATDAGRDAQRVMHKPRSATQAIVHPNNASVPTYRSPHHGATRSTSVGRFFLAGRPSRQALWDVVAGTAVYRTVEGHTPATS